MKKPNKVAIDGDIIAFKAASAIEDRYIVVTHVPSGRVKQFDSRTDFYGHHSKKAGGWLGDVNAERIEQGKEPFDLSEFVIEDDRDVEPLEHSLHIAKQLIQGIVKACGVDEYVIVGDGEDNFRKEVATICEYKGNRKDLIRPLYLDEVKEYLATKHPFVSTHSLEGDDVLSIMAYRGEAIQCTIDKDAYMTPCWLYDFDKADKPFEIKDGVGKLWEDGKGKHRAMGFKSLCKQLLCGDTTDAILPRALTNKRFGEKKAVALLSPLKSKKDCLQAVLDTYKTWYGTPVEYLHWNTGEEITASYFDIASEMFTLLYMLRDYDDNTTLSSLCDELDVKVEL